MASPALIDTAKRTPRNAVLHGDCTGIMNRLTEGSVDFILTDPPYMVNYRAHSGERVANDDNADWLHPAACAMYRLLKKDGLCVSFYGWTKTDLFIEAWRAAGFCIVGHITFCKRYASSSGFLRRQHESAYLLAKGSPALPADPVADVLDFPYSGNRLHPTEKPVAALTPLIECFTKPGDLVLDPFCGSGSTLAAARMLGRDWLGMELNARYCHTARRRME